VCDSGDLDTVKQMWASYREDGLITALELLADDVAFIDHRGRRVDGPDGVRTFFAVFAGRGERFVAAPFTFEPSGYGVLVPGHRRIASPDGSVEEYLHFAHRVVDGRIVELSAHTTREEALKALGEG